VVADTAGYFALSLAAMEWLVEQGGLRLNPASPFGFLAVAPRQTTPQEQSAAAKSELGRWPRASLARVLSIAAQPEARIRLTVVSPGQAPQQNTLLRRGFSVVEAGFNKEGFFFGEPLGVGELEGRLTGQLKSEAPSAGATDRLIPPRALTLLTALWQRGRVAGTAAVSGSDAVAACQRLGADEATARGLINGLVASEFVNEKDGELLLDVEWRPWLDRVWSGALFEVEVTPLPDGPFDAAQLAERRQRLLFVGRAGQRIVSRAVDATSLEETPLGVPVQHGQAEPFVALSYLDDKSLARTLGAFLGLNEEGLRDSSSTSSQALARD
jgi:hypothetical protein